MRAKQQQFSSEASLLLDTAEKQTKQNQPKKKELERISEETSDLIIGIMGKISFL